MNTQLQDSQILESELRVAHKDSEADSIHAKNQELSEAIDVLLGVELDNWASEAGPVKDGLDVARGKFDKAVADIKRRVEIAQNVIKVLGCLDDAIKITTAIIP
jgi:hypothetical protein